MTLVINEPTAMCCGEPTGKCRCSGHSQVRNVSPIPRPDWDGIFKQDAGVSEVETPKEPVLNSVCRSVGKATHTPLGIPAWDF